jgi:hypothetical protein
LPHELRGKLRETLESLDAERIDAIIHQVAFYDKKLYKMLVHLTGEFDYPSILTALQTD